MNAKRLISFVIRTRNPDPDIFQECLRSIQNQTNRSGWESELIIVDNGSTPALEGRFDISWNPRNCIVREERRGKVMAQAKGIKEASGEILLWVDDDNLLPLDYVEIGLQKLAEYPQLGAWGCGWYELILSAPVPNGYEPFLSLLTAIQLERCYISNLPQMNRSVPAGAGMFIQKNIAAKWVELFENDPARKLWLHDNPPVLFAEDTDMALCAPDLGFFTAVFPDLKLKHKHKEGRISQEALKKAAFNMQFSEVLLKSVRNLDPRSKGKVLLDECWECFKSLLATQADKQIRKSLLRGRHAARRLLSIQNQ